MLLLVSLYFLISLEALWFNDKLKKEGFTGIPTVQCFNPLKWVSVFFGYTMKWLIPQHIFEQYVLRFYDEECRVDCMLKGKCITCGCDAIAKGWSPKEKCSNNNWGPIVFNKRKYKALRDKYPVNIKITYKD